MNERFRTAVLISFSIFLILALAELVASQSLTWLKKDAHVLYEGSAGDIILMNGTKIGSAQRTTVGWDCVGIQGNIAELRLKVSIEQRYKTQTLSGTMYVDMVTRNVTLLNGTRAGKTMLWLPSDPKDGDPAVYVGWQVHDTLQGAQRVFGVINQSGLYDLDTGILLQGLLSGEATLRALNISNPEAVGVRYIIETDIDLGPREWYPEFMKALPFLLPVIAFASISLFMIRQRMKRHRRVARKPE